MTSETSTLRRLRKVARDSGFDIKARNGGYMLTHTATNTLVAGDRYQLDLKDVAKHLQRLGVLGYGGRFVSETAKLFNQLVGGFFDQPPVYEPSHIKRGRVTKAEVAARREALLDIIREMRPMTVRQVFYQATVRGLVEKEESGYAKVQTDLVVMRRDGSLPYDWLADNTRWQRKPRTFDSMEEAVQETARFYRKSLWANADAYVEIWLEKDALAGVVLPVTSMYDVPLMVARGYASLSFLHSAAEHMATVGKPVYVYHLGDFDPSGVNAGEKIEQTLREMAPQADIHFERLAVTPDQITALSLPTRPTKVSDSRAKKFGKISVELDAIHPQTLRDMVEAAINQHLPQDEYRILREAERSERDILVNWARAFGDAA